MSRIHEALKKAEQERAPNPLQESAPVQAARVVIASPEAATQTDEAARTNGATPASVGADTILSPTPYAAPANGYLRFDDIRKQCTHPEWRPDPNSSVFTNPALSDQGAEQFRTLRSRLYQVRNTQPLKTLLVTSSVPGEGKTFVTMNLAHAIVRQPDRRVLVIDADLRCPRVHTVLGAPSSPGLTDYLRGEANEFSVIQHGPEGNLCMIPGGSEVTNPSELLCNGRLNTLLERMAPVFDWIIMDSPPCLPVADPSILAGIVHGVLLVVKAGATPSAVAQKGRQELQAANIVGVVLNAVGEAHMDNAGYYRAYRYGYGENKAKSAAE
jgi:protein-tyrosine kinase